MKKTFTVKCLAAVLCVIILGFAAVGCAHDGNGTTADKTALNAEIALAINAQGDYTKDSYDKYTEKLTAAKAVAEDTSATQDGVDRALKALTEARLELSVREVEEVEGGKRVFSLRPSDKREITLADYVNVNGLSKITFEIKASGDEVTLSPVTDGKFTVTAGEVSDNCELTVSVTVLYDGAQKLKVELKVLITPAPEDSNPGYVPDDNVDGEW